MGKYDSYPEYSNTTIDFLSSVPSNWDIKPLKFVSSINDDVLPESTHPDTEFSYVDIGSVSMDKGIVRTEPMKFENAPSRARRKVKTGDVIVSTVRTYLKAIAAINQDADSLVVSTGFCVIRPRYGLLSAYSGYLLQAPFVVEQIVSESVGVSYPAISSSQIAKIKVPLPTLKEQTRIAAFLDRETAKIDRLIEKQQRLIELLEEKRQAVISHAVTKGLNPDVPMKDSGVEWLGGVPEHWEVKQLKRLIKSLESGVSVNATDVPATASEYGVLKTSCVYTRFFRPEENKTVVEEEVYRVKCPVRAGAIIISRMNTPDLVGASAYVEHNHENLFLPDRLWQTVFDNSVKVNAEYLSYFMMVKSFKEQISLYAAGTSSSMQNIAKEDYLSISVCLPTMDEQSQIIGYIKDQQQKLEKLALRSHKAIELLKERRTALISAAVTGKIDVRDQAPQDVEEAVAS